MRVSAASSAAAAAAAASSLRAVVASAAGARVASSAAATATTSSTAAVSAAAAVAAARSASATASARAAASAAAAAVSARAVRQQQQQQRGYVYDADKTEASVALEAGVVERRDKYLSPSLATFQAYDQPLALQKASMQHMWDVHGNKYVDLLGQNLSISVGHCHPVVTKAAVEQMQQLPHCTTMYHNEQSAKLAEELVAKVPPHPSGQDWVVHLVNSGSEAVDLAVQMARCYTGRPEMIGLHKAYHGLHGYACGLTAIGKATQPSYGSMFTGIHSVAANDLEGLDAHLTFATGGSIAAFIAEPLQGYGGILPLDDGYLAGAFELARKRGGLAIADEVQTGYGRCGQSFWGFQMPHHLRPGDDETATIPDMITIAKGMGNGCGLIAAVICRRDIAEAFSTKMFFNTYGANPVASAAARAVLRVYDDEKVLENSANMGALFTKGLSQVCADLPEVYKEIRGSGLFQGLEVAGGNTLEESGATAYELHRRLRKLGVVVGRGSAAGNVFRVQPPMCIQEDDVKLVVDSIRAVGEEWLSEQLTATSKR